MVDPTKFFHATVVEVHSGDDLILNVHAGFDNVFKRVRCRLQGVDTPDAYRSSAGTAAREVRDKVKNLTQSKVCLVEVYLQNANKSGWVVTLRLGPSMEDPILNEMLREDGYIFEVHPQ